MLARRRTGRGLVGADSSQPSQGRVTRTEPASATGRALTVNFDTERDAQHGHSVQIDVENNTGVVPTSLPYLVYCTPSYKQAFFCASHSAV